MNHDEDDAELAIEAVSDSAADRIMALANAHVAVTDLFNAFSQALQQANGQLSQKQLLGYMKKFDHLVTQNDPYLGTGQAEYGPAMQQRELLLQYKGDTRKLMLALLDENREMQALDLMLHMLPRNWKPAPADNNAMLDRINLIVDRINYVQRKMAAVLAPEK